MRNNMELEHEDLAVLRLFGSECLNDTVKRLGFAAAYSVDRDWKLRVCRLRNEISEWDCVKWIRFYVEELQRMSFKVIAVKGQSSSREKEATMPGSRYGDKPGMESRLFGKGSWKPITVMGMFESLG